MTASIMTAGVVLHLTDADATERLAHALAKTAPRPAVVWLQGDLGAGKSTLARGWLRALGVAGAIRSPTYTLVERYALAEGVLAAESAQAIDGSAAGGEALHLDLYRIADGAELEFLGLDDADAALWLVEWPERGGDALPAPDLRVALAIEGQGRRCELVPMSPAGASWLQSLATAQGVAVPC
jgi:tRNA threonylcarbamoyladenosine biosynthesis protein TsaE